MAGTGIGEDFEGDRRFCRGSPPGSNLLGRLEGVRIGKVQLQRHAGSGIGGEFGDAVQEEQSGGFGTLCPEGCGDGCAHRKSAEHCRCRQVGDCPFGSLEKRSPADPVPQGDSLADRAGNAAIVKIRRYHLVTGRGQALGSIALERAQTVGRMEEDYGRHSHISRAGGNVGAANRAVSLSHQ
ncbi:hypothetical protein ATY31_01930 [Sinorhizobium americanum]|uniref:Uncharacterized protein n=1 Tax=Sinorhizobium americanum TaxID=194963 RepID=A0A2S3YVB8_9HYPH|nr:hypothetical protein ATY31_01930 [Sinorhizobium americanum]